MTAITILGGDFEILFEDETVGGNAVAGMKMVRRTSGATATNYTTNALYSAIADASDDFQAMGFENPMLPVTPNAYTMENDYFIPRSSTEWLDEGAIGADWTTNIRSIVYTQTVAFVPGDIGRQIIGGTTLDTGTLLDYEVLPDATLILWIRPDDPLTDLFDDAAETLSVVADGGAGNGTSTAISETGNHLYSSIQVIGSVPTATEVYLVQERQKMSDSEGTFQWWTTDTNVSLGIIDVLIRVRLNDTYVADGDVEVFGRRYTSLYDNFRLNIAAGGRSALPLASAPDINNTTGYWAGVWQTGTGTPMLVGDLLSNTTAGKLEGKYVVTAVADGGATGTFEYYNTGDLTDFATTDTFTSVNRNGIIDGAPTANSGGPTDGGAGEGGTVTIVLGTTTVDHDGDAIAEPYSVTINAQNDVSASKVYERIKYATRRGATTADLFGAGVNVPGETYRGLEAQAQYNTPTGTFGEGEDVDVLATGFTARVISVNTTDTYVMLTDQQTSIKSLATSDILRDEALDTVIIDSSPTQFTSPKSSPFGTFTGTQIFGARGIVFINPASADTQSYILTDDNGTLRSPPNTVSYIVNNTVAGDRVLVAHDTGTSGIIDKDQFGGLSIGGSPLSNGLGDSSILVAGTIDSEVPESGFVRIVETALQEEHHYVYDARVTGVDGTFALRSIPLGTVTTASTTQIIDTGSNFVTANAEIGMLVRGTNNGKTTHVWEVTAVAPGSPAATDTLTVKQLYGPLDATQDWDIGDTFEINRLIGDHTVPTDYAVTDDVFDLILDTEATSTTTTNTFVKTLAVPFSTVVNVRQGKVILPFTQNASVGDSGTTVTVVRTPDTIAT